jgi:hypothetical protein
VTTITSAGGGAKTTTAFGETIGICGVVIDLNLPAINRRWNGAAYPSTIVSPFSVLP